VLFFGVFSLFFLFCEISQFCHQAIVLPFFLSFCFQDCRSLSTSPLSLDPQNGFVKMGFAKWVFAHELDAAEIPVIRK
jgi:hypothetical protein